jgi:hypothetical protein
MECEIMSIEYDQGWRYIVWVDGIDDYFVHYQDAKDEYDGWIDGGYDGVFLVELGKNGEEKILESKPYHKRLTNYNV